MTGALFHFVKMIEALPLERRTAVRISLADIYELLRP